MFLNIKYFLTFITKQKAKTFYRYANDNCVLNICCAGWGHIVVEVTVFHWEKLIYRIFRVTEKSMPVFKVSELCFPPALCS